MTTPAVLFVILILAFAITWASIGIAQAIILVAIGLAAISFAANLNPFK